jgi:hypothetical protein
MTLFQKLILRILYAILLELTTERLKDTPLYASEEYSELGRDLEINGVYDKSDAPMLSNKRQS